MSPFRRYIFTLITRVLSLLTRSERSCERRRCITGVGKYDAVPIFGAKIKTRCCRVLLFDRVISGTSINRGSYKSYKAQSPGEMLFKKFQNLSN